jgi:flagellar biogenesis protein FliO
MLAALAGLALYLARRRPSGGRRLVQVLETASLGPKRQLVVVRLRDDLLLLGSSEAGVTLLSTQPAPESLPATADGRPAAVEPPRGERLAGRLAGLWSSLRGGGRAPAPTSFDDLLQETSDDLELRRKLASGRPGRVA